MNRICLFRPRTVWLPTIWGGLMLIIAMTLLTVLIGRNLYGFLAPNAPVDARVLVVEGWLAPKELDQAIRVFAAGKYDRVITTGGPVTGWTELFRHTNYAEVAADYLAQHGIAREVITAVPAPASAQERTFLSAVMLRDFFLRHGIRLNAFNLFSSGPHARRSHLLFRMAFGPEVNIGVLAGYPGDYDGHAWWKSSAGIESVFFQAIGLMWVKCLFWPGPPHSRSELWAEVD